jgi:hypothetical protein
MRQTIVPREEARCFEEVSLPEGLDDTSLIEWVAQKVADEQVETDLSRDLFRVFLFTDDARTRAWFCVVAHHLLVDALSFRFVLRELMRAYREALGENASLRQVNVVPSFKDFSEKSVSFWLAHSREHASYWLNRPWGVLKALAPTRSLGSPDNTERYSTQVRQQLTHVSPTVRFHAARASGSRGLADAFVAGVARAYMRWTGHPLLHLALVMHGRTDVDLARPALDTVGWLSETVPIIVDARADGASLIRDVAAQIETAASIGRSFGVARYLSPGCPEFKGLPDPEISLNIKLADSGQSANGSVVVAETAPMMALTTPETQRVFLISGGIFAQDGRYWIAWDFSRKLFDPHQISTFVTLCDAEITKFAELAQ